MATSDREGSRPGAREAIIEAAERLIALRGPTVPTRDIAMSAGQRNNSAVQYHFDSREDLIVAVIERRAPALEVRRLERLVEAEENGLGDDPATLVAALVTPLLEAPMLDGTWYYARFLEQVRIIPTAMSRPTLDAHRAAAQLIRSRLRRSIPPTTEDRIERRLDVFGVALFALAAEHERGLEIESNDDADRVGTEEAIVGALTAILVADVPSGIRTLARAKRRAAR